MVLVTRGCNGSIIWCDRAAVGWGGLWINSSKGGKPWLLVVTKWCSNIDVKTILSCLFLWNKYCPKLSKLVITFVHFFILPYFWGRCEALPILFDFDGKIKIFWFLVRWFCKWFSLSIIVCNHWLLRVRGSFCILNFLFNVFLQINPCPYWFL